MIARDYWFRSARGSIFQFMDQSRLSWFIRVVSTFTICDYNSSRQNLSRSYFACYHSRFL